MSVAAQAVMATYLEPVQSYLGKTRTGQDTVGKDTLSASKPIVPEDSPTSLETSSVLKAYSGLASRFKELSKLAEADEFGPMRPSNSNIARSLALFFPFAQRGSEFPEPLDLGVDHDGAIRLVWENGTRFLELIVPRENHEAPYLYHSDADRYGLERNLSNKTLRDRFAWLSGRG